MLKSDRLTMIVETQGLLYYISHAPWTYNRKLEPFLLWFDRSWLSLFLSSVFCVIFFTLYLAIRSPIFGTIVGRK